ncbi:MAG: hypothetical protein OQL27_00060 [Sedimenticola sp.]|nr:hypothetical protein [Sedimenticola sp.]
MLSLLLGFYTPATAQQPNNSLSKPLVSGMYAHIQIRIHPSYAEAIDALLQLKGKNVRELLGLAGFEVGLDQQYENFRTDMQSAKGFDGEK